MQFRKVPLKSGLDEGKAHTPQSNLVMEKIPISNSVQLPPYEEIITEAQEIVFPNERLTELFEKYKPK